MIGEHSSPTAPADNHLGQYEPSPSDLAAFDKFMDWIGGLTREELRVAICFSRDVKAVVC